MSCSACSRAFSSSGFRSKTLSIAGTNGIVFKVGFNGPNYAGTMCGVPGEGYTGAWVTAQNP